MILNGVLKKSFFRIGIWHSRPVSTPPLHGKYHLKFPFWLSEHLPNDLLLFIACVFGVLKENPHFLQDTIFWGLWFKESQQGPWLIFKYCWQVLTGRCKQIGEPGKVVTVWSISKAHVICFWLRMNLVWDPLTLLNLLLALFGRLKQNITTIAPDNVFLPLKLG